MEAFRVLGGMVATPPAALVSSPATTLGVAPAEIVKAILIYLFLPGYAAVPSRFVPVLAEHGMTPLYALSSSPTALPPSSVHIHLALMETEAAPHLAPDATAPAFGSGSTSVAAPTHAPAGGPYSPFLPGMLAALGVDGCFAKLTNGAQAKKIMKVGVGSCKN
ncbi:hypothetical protein E2562_014258 [Oryza meyeriana var. granulata]|uniref:Uncharacterized protein n=1 Tax=Oryza meyeriana var. granulata TaxID=110450 RepID=A0A6G1BL47_9ORYZ|nr:hypothetical protein E2562_014258 [Oryza meyeriana var. granulata]